ncbi:hypothetical protein [Dickeya dianthicola]|uniref:hypothetical protein n=1 Tax=Dickeya dianthicola TaxID=204039 RepID=UPI003019F511
MAILCMARTVESTAWHGIPGQRIAIRTVITKYVITNYVIKNFPAMRGDENVCLLWRARRVAVGKKARSIPEEEQNTMICVRILTWFWRISRNGFFNTSGT